MAKFKYLKNKRIKRGLFFDKIKIGPKIYLFRFFSASKLMDAAARIIMNDDFKDKNLIGENSANLKKKYANDFLIEFENWDCFSIEKKILKTFFEGQWNPLKRAEKQFIDQLRHIKGDYAVIMVTQSTDPSTINHEIAHALWSTNRNYKKKIIKELNKVDLKPVFKILDDFGYQEAHYIDEAQAYLAHNLGWLKKQGLNCKNYLELSSKLRLIFEEYI